MFVYYSLHLCLAQEVLAQSYWSQAPVLKHDCRLQSLGGLCQYAAVLVFNKCPHITVLLIASPVSSQHKGSVHLRNHLTSIYSGGHLTGHQFIGGTNVLLHAIGTS
eukprot:scaffold277729_cov35-Prasinocladus_malaysianus.AAC.2